MAVTVKIPAQLRAATGGEGEIEVEAVDRRRGARRRLRRSTTDLRERITEDGDLRRFVNVYVSGEDIRFQDGLETTIDDGDEVTILPAVAGGCSRRASAEALDGGRSRRDPLRRPRYAAAGADPRDPEGAGRDRRPADPLARDPDLRRAGLRPLPARDRLPRRDDRRVRRRRELARRGRGRVRRHRRSTRRPAAGSRSSADRLGGEDLLRDLRRRRRRRRSRRPRSTSTAPTATSATVTVVRPALAVGRRRARRRGPGQRLRREAAHASTGSTAASSSSSPRRSTTWRGLERARARAARSDSPPTGSCAPTATRASGTAWTPTRTRWCSTTSGRRATPPWRIWDAPAADPVRRALVTGGRGFVGAWLCRGAARARRRGRLVRPARRRTSRPLDARAARDRRRGRARLGATCVDARARSTGSLARARCRRRLPPRGRDDRRHRPGRSPRQAFETNVRGTWTLLEACREHDVSSGSSSPPRTRPTARTTSCPTARTSRCSRPRPTRRRRRPPT